MAADHPGVSYWSGYCNTHVRVYADEDAYIILAPQVMSYSPAAGAMAEVPPAGLGIGLAPTLWGVAVLG